MRNSKLIVITRRLLTPDKIPGINIAVWFSTMESGSVILDGTTVSQWSDISGNNRHATQATKANQPTYTPNGLNGKPVLTFYAANPSVMNIPSGQLGGATEASLFWVQKNVNDPPISSMNAGSFINKNFGDSQGANHLPWTDSAVYFQAFSTTRHAVGNLTPSFALPRIVEVESKNDLFNLFVDGTVQFTTSTNTYVNPSGLKQIGGDTQFNVYFLGYAAELIVVSSILSTPHRQQFEGYLAWRWGLQANLVNNHPFKFSPPYI
jgi:hypothetical protein